MAIFLEKGGEEATSKRKKRIVSDKAMLPRPGGLMQMTSPAFERDREGSCDILLHWCWPENP